MVKEIWDRRFRSLQQRIATFQASLSSAPTFSRQATLITLAANLYAFAEEQFRYFYQGFSDGTLQASPEHPPEHVLTIILEQISYDLEAFQWAAQQRISGDDDTKEALDLGDKLTWQALKPAVDRFHLQGVTTLVYFQKFAEIRVIPYAKIALIGLPITCIPMGESSHRQIVARDFLAIPHEVGHYVYWHGKVEKAGEIHMLHDYLRTEIGPKLCRGSEWLEELFADVYGCLIAGPAIAASFQDLQMRVSHKRFLSNDGEHPTPFIRPDIYTKVLSVRYPEWATHLNKRWQEQRNSRLESAEAAAEQLIHYGREGKALHPYQLITSLDSAGQAQANGKVDKPLDVAVRDLLSELDKLPTNIWWSSSFGAAPDEGDSLADDEIYSRLETHIMTTRDSLDDPDEVSDDSPDPANLRTRWAEAAGRAFSRERAERRRWAGSEASEVTAPENSSRIAWLGVLRAGGWATKGPENNPIGGPG